MNLKTKKYDKSVITRKIKLMQINTKNSSKFFFLFFFKYFLNNFFLVLKISQRQRRDIKEVVDTMRQRSRIVSIQDQGTLFQ